MIMMILIMIKLMRIMRRRGKRCRILVIFIMIRKGKTKYE